MSTSIPVAPVSSSTHLASLARPAAKSSTASAVLQDTYAPRRTESPERIHKDPVSTRGKKEALQFAGLGVMMGGMLAAAAIGGKWAPALMMAALFGGLALMAAARD